MEKIYYVYEWIRLDTNEPFYIGKGHGNRWCDMRCRNKHFNNIVKKYPVAVNILEDNLGEKESYEYECWYIHQYKYVLGYPLVNVCDGGEGTTLIGPLNPMYGISVKDRMDEKTYSNWLIARQGENAVRPMLGKTHSEEAREKIRKSATGRKHTEEWKKTHSEQLKGRKHTLEHRKKVSESKMGGKHPLAVKVICVDTGEIFESMSDAARKYNVSKNSIYNCCKGISKTCIKMKWEYIK